MAEKKWKVLVTDSLSRQGLDILNEKGYEVKTDPSLDGDSLAGVISEYDALLIRSGTNVTADIIEKAERLRIIGRAGVGVDNVDIDAATRKGIVVMNVPAGNTVSACEHTWALILSLLRNVSPSHQALKEGRWDKKKYKGTELYGKTLGILGLGKIGCEVGKRAGAFGMKIIACDPYASEEMAGELSARLVEFDELLEKSDIITIHSPLNDKTRNLFNAESISRMKKSAFLVNCARGGIVNEEDLSEALEKGVIKGAALDVYPKEPVTDSPVFKMDSAVCTPHLGAATSEAQERVAVEIVKQAVHYLETGRMINAVNAFAQDMDPDIRELAEKLGVVCGQLSENLAESVRISYRDKMEKAGDSLTVTVLKGYLSQFIEGVNLINARVLARERGVEIVSQSVSGDTRMLGDIRVFFNEDFSVEGGIIGGVPRLTGLNGYIFDIPLSGNLLVIINADRPGVIGHIGTVLGENSINIASMEVGRKSAGGEAVTVIEIDGDIPEELKEKIQKIEYITQVKNIRVGQ